MDDVSASGLTKSEGDFKAMAEAAGLTLLRGGWPDFVVIDRYKRVLLFVEIKTGMWPQPTKSQKAMHALLEGLGFAVAIVTPEYFTPLVEELTERAKLADPTDYDPRLRRSKRSPVTMEQLEALVTRRADYLDTPSAGSVPPDTSQE